MVHLHTILSYTQHGLNVWLVCGQIAKGNQCSISIIQAKNIWFETKEWISSDITLTNTKGSFYACTCRSIGSRIIESAVYCNQIPLAPSQLNSSKIRRLLLSLLCWPKVILLNGGLFISISLAIKVVKQFLKTRIRFISNSSIHLSMQ